MSQTPVDWPTTLPLPRLDGRVEAITFSFRTEMESGRKRVRRTVESPWYRASLHWVFTVEQFESFQQFYEETLERGTIPFRMSGILQNEIWTCLFHRDYAFAYREGSYEVSADVHVISIFRRRIYEHREDAWLSVYHQWGWHRYWPETTVSGGTFVSGAYIPKIVTVQPPVENVGTTSAFFSGAYIPKVQTYSLSPENGNIRAAFNSGTYTLKVIPTSLSPEQGSVWSGFGSGNYVLKIGGTYSHLDQAASSAGFHQGSYA